MADLNVLDPDELSKWIQETNNAFAEFADSVAKTLAPFFESLRNALQSIISTPEFQEFIRLIRDMRPKRKSKSERVHIRRMKQAARR